ncbi:MAG TPA: polysaccharide pyruvyl transferase family protein [Coleofasciculaceae cyanobacterium]
MDTTTPENIKVLLHEALKRLPIFKECALLSYPNHYNIGDHLIWLGTIFYLVDTLGVQIKYASSIESFSGEEMEKRIGTAPILLLGGGNLGDLWSYYQSFYEKIISKYRQQPIIILPQSIRFNNPERLEKAKKIFNQHPNLILFVRENQSYEFSQKHFYNCAVVKAPDMALHLVNKIGKLPFEPKPQDTTLYLCRKDGELNPSSSPTAIDLPNLVIEDWTSYRYKGAPKANSIQGMTCLLREGWEQGTVLPMEWLSRQVWQHFHPDVLKFNNLYNPSSHQKSWNFIHNGVYQFKQHRLIITNRLHGHILGIILKIPHVFLANSYHKNQSFYKTWTYQIPFCQFIQDASQVKHAAQELLDLYSQ